MDPLYSIWYFLEYQRQSSDTDQSLVEFSSKTPLRPKKSVKGGLIEFGVPFFVLAVLVGFGLVCFLWPTVLP